MTLKINHKTTSLLAFLAFFLSFTSTAQDVEEQLEEFIELKTFNAVEVEVIPSSENRIVITGHSKHDVKFKIVEDRLEVRLSLDNLWSKDNTRITLYTKELTTIDANEGTFVEVKDEIEGEEFTFRAQEGATIHARVNGRKIHAKAISGGKVVLEGKAEEQVVETNTGGNYFGKNLTTEKTEVSASTMGKAEVYAKDYVKATAKLGGTVEIFGNPPEVDTKTSLGGKIL